MRPTRTTHCTTDVPDWTYAWYSSRTTARPSKWSRVVPMNVDVAPARGLATEATHWARSRGSCVSTTWSPGLSPADASSTLLMVTQVLTATHWRDHCHLRFAGDHSTLVCVLLIHRQVRGWKHGRQQRIRHHQLSDAVLCRGTNRQ